MFNDMLEDFMKQLPGNGNANETNNDIYIDQICPNPDNMTYEQLLELQEKIGYVSKGLKEEDKKVKKSFYLKKLNLLNCKIFLLFKILENTNKNFQ